MPAISQLADPSIYGSQQAPKGTSLQEMLDLSRSNVAFQREKALAPFQVQQGQAQAQTAVTQSNTAQLDNSLKHIQSIVQNQQTLLTKPDLTSDDIVNATKAQAARMGTPESAVNQALAGIPVNGTPSELRSYLAINLAKTLGAQSQLEKMYPSGILPGQIPSTYQPSVAPEAPICPVGAASKHQPRLRPACPARRCAAPSRLRPPVAPTRLRLDQPPTMRQNRWSVREVFLPD
jgi:hypothetical protein